MSMCKILSDKIDTQTRQPVIVIEKEILANCLLTIMAESVSFGTCAPGSVRHIHFDKRLDEWFKTIQKLQLQQHPTEGDNGK